jgi:hypothetical protein
MIIEQVRIVAAHASALAGMGHTPDACTVEGLAGLAKCSREDVSYDGNDGWCRHNCYSSLSIVPEKQMQPREAAGGWFLVLVAVCGGADAYCRIVAESARALK